MPGDLLSGGGPEVMPLRPGPWVMPMRPCGQSALASYRYRCPYLLFDALAPALLYCFLPSLLSTILPQYHPVELQNEVVSIDCNMFTSAPRVVCFDSGICISAKQTLLANPRSCPFQEFCLLPYLVMDFCNRQVWTCQIKIRSSLK